VSVMPAVHARPTPVAGHVTIEKTSKPLKLQKALAICCFILGGAVLSVSVPAAGGKPISPDDNPGVFIGFLLTNVGFWWYVVTRMRIWWHHG